MKSIRQTVEEKKVVEAVKKARLKNLEEKAYKLAQMERAYYSFDPSVTENDLRFFMADFCHDIMFAFGYEFVFEEEGGSFWTDIDGKEVI